ncbi:MAG: DUF4430 domain-containing protein [Candidatus Paceibacterota bacterium]|jgi:hypothetical protein
MPTYKKLAPFVIALAAAVGVFAYAPERVATPSPDVSDAVASEATANTTLSVGGVAYPITVAQGETVIDAMRALASSSTFTFIGREYPALGFFVDSINGQENAGGMYWILYINGVSATVGAGATEVHAGDTVEWKYEKSY